MYIGLIAHDAKKKLMQNFCIAYRGILSKHELYATGTTGRLIEEVTNLTLHKYLPGSSGRFPAARRTDRTQSDRSADFPARSVGCRSRMSQMLMMLSASVIFTISRWRQTWRRQSFSLRRLTAAIWNGGRCTNEKTDNRTCGRTDALRYQHADRLWCPRSGTGIFISRTGSADDASGRCRAGRPFLRLLSAYRNLQTAILLQMMR